MDQERIIKRYYSSHIRPFLEKPSVLDSVIVDREIEDWDKAATKYSDEPIHNEEPVQWNMDSQTNGEQLNIDSDDDARKEQDLEI